VQAEISGGRGLGMNTVKQLERQIRDLQKELLDAKKEADLLRLQPCTGDFELRKKDEAMTEIETRVETINQTMRELEKKRREMMSAVMKNSVYESPFN
jgi:chromosome segregation ATPase